MGSNLTNAHSGDFVHDKDFFIFIKNLNGNIFRINFGIPRRICQYNADNIAGFDFVVGFDNLVIHQDIPRSCSILDTVAGGILNFVTRYLSILTMP